MTGDLFRREALEARKQDWLGSVHLSTTRLGWAMAILAGTLILAVVLIVAFGGYTRKAPAQGRLVPIGGLPDVAAVAPGVVTRLLVTEGETVAAGQPLVEISPDIDVPNQAGRSANASPPNSNSGGSACSRTWKTWKPRSVSRLSHCGSVSRLSNGAWPRPKPSWHSGADRSPRRNARWSASNPCMNSAS
ncbi:HlyD family secretion protein [Marilutibacter alkalisoli]|uniref:Biotin/lipoyl-binding protein n=1 Tax=Marilutibacter alkalisoli TaxID=2591633 RepID=A0A514BR41_9GAMM|nr:biotin/lipoyl-binding protein [Lysobacter alkalisoli]QDH69850.1 biotin/lipoyl-binding protein [Lysobacter alkalisoli]